MTFRDEAGELRLEHVAADLVLVSASSVRRVQIQSRLTRWDGSASNNVRHLLRKVVSLDGSPDLYRLNSGAGTV